MKKILVLFLFVAFAATIHGQTPYDTVNVRDPQNFVEMTTVDTAYFQLIGRKANLNRRMSLTTLKNWILSGVSGIDTVYWSGDTLNIIQGLTLWQAVADDNSGLFDASNNDDTFRVSTALTRAAFTLNGTHPFRVKNPMLLNATTGTPLYALEITENVNGSNGIFINNSHASGTTQIAFSESGAGTATWGAYIQRLNSSNTLEMWTADTGPLSFGTNNARRLLISGTTGQLTLDGYANNALNNVDSSLYVLAVDATGDVHTRAASGLGGDDLGDHTATQDINMAGYDIAAADTVEIGSGAQVWKLWRDGAGEFLYFTYGQDEGQATYALRLDQTGVARLGGLDGYDMPAADGTGGQVLTTDGAGQASWGDITQSATTGRTFNDTILLDNILGVYYSDYTQTGTVNFVVAPSGHKVGATGYMRLVADGINPVNFSADFTYVYGFTSGNTLEAGTYEIYFQKTPVGVSVSIPNSVAALNVIDPISYNPYLALVADSTSTITKSGGKVSAWASINGGDYTMRQPTSGNRPLYVNDTFDYVQFSRDTSQYMSQDTIAMEGKFNGVSKAFTTVIVFSTQDTTNNAFQTIWAAGENGGSNIYVKNFGYTADDSLQIQVRVDALSAYPDNIKKFGDKNSLGWHIVVASYDGSSLSIYLDGALVADAIPFNDNIDNGVFNKFAIGALSRATVGSYADVRIRRLYMYDDAFNQAVLYRFSQWLNNIYSIY